MHPLLFMIYKSQSNYNNQIINHCINEIPLPINLTKYSIKNKTRRAAGQLVPAPARKSNKKSNQIFKQCVCQVANKLQRSEIWFLLLSSEEVQSIKLLSTPPQPCQYRRAAAHLQTELQHRSIFKHCVTPALNIAHMYNDSRINNDKWLLRIIVVFFALTEIKSSWVIKIIVFFSQRLSSS